ncbi:MAG TPA: branched-chain amino acid ABC transporter permease [Xanthobacteraceae bacterium]|nr:branched-chain amino acid ABC transporter permease [Xanthobacteraceae bacterium]
MFQLVLSGLSLGCVYGLVALGYNITFATSRTLNFAQGSAMMLGAVVALILIVDFGWPTLLAMTAAVAVLGVFGLVLERVAVRPFVSRGSMAWVMSTLAVGIIIENIALLVFGKSPRGLPNVLAQEPVTIAGAGIYPLELVIPVVVLLVAGGARLFFGSTMLGRALRATAFDREASLAVGINVNRMVGLSYALSSMLAAVAGVLIGPLIGVSSNMGFLIGLKAFAVAIVGGLEHPIGILLASLAYAVAENLVGGYLGSSAKEIFGFGLVILVLCARPTGLFGGKTLRRA